MPQPTLTDAQKREAVDAVNKAIKAGYRWNGPPSALRAAAQALRLNPGTLRNRVFSAIADGMIVEEIKDQPREVEFVAKPRVRVKVQSGSDAPVYRVLGIGDAHDGPNLPDKSRFKWIARQAAEMRPDYILQVGDLFTFDSLNRFDKPGSLPQKTRPSFMLDLESGEEALAAFYKECPPDIEKRITLGNHDTRPLKYETGDASIEGALWSQVTDLLARYNWRAHGEGEFFFIGSVGAVHCPRTLMNKEYGGKTLNAIANDAVFSIIFGHSHRGQIVHAPKIGPFGGVTILNLGTCLPTGYVADYAKVATHSWTYGTWQLTIQGGNIVGHQFVSMEELRERYGD